MFGQCVIDLIGVLLVLMRYPKDIEQLSDDEVEDVKSHRYDVADVLHDVCRVLGAVPSLRQMVLILEQEVCFVVLAYIGWSSSSFPRCLLFYFILYYRVFTYIYQISC